MKLAIALWLGLFGVWPIAHPSHTTWLDPWTWLDWPLHLGASVWLGWQVGKRIANSAWVLGEEADR